MSHVGTIDSLSSGSYPTSSNNHDMPLGALYQQLSRRETAVRPSGAGPTLAGSTSKRATFVASGMTTTATTSSVVKTGAGVELSPSLNMSRKSVRVLRPSEIVSSGKQPQQPSPMAAAGRASILKPSGGGSGGGGDGGSSGASPAQISRKISSVNW